jgi:hypothetical protein
MLFTTFLFYPHVSSTILGLYSCIDIGGQTLMVEDMTVTCWEGEHLRWASILWIFIIVYPIGVPMIFFLLLLKFRKRMLDPMIVLSIGFVFNAYTEDAWFWELLELGQKLFLTGLIFFFPPTLELPINMAVLGLYLILLLVVNPYIRKGDDRLALFAQSELFILAMFGYTLTFEEALEGDLTDVILSILLILGVFMVTGTFLVMSIRNSTKIYKTLKRRKQQKNAQKQIIAEAKKRRSTASNLSMGPSLDSSDADSDSEEVGANPWV